MRHTAEGYWLEEAGPVEPRAALDRDLDVDVVVVGGGYAGMWTASELLERGTSVALLEARVCGHGPSGRNGGFVDNLWHPAPRLRDRFGDAAALALGRASNESVRGIGAWCEAEVVDAWYRPAPQLIVSAAPAQDGIGAEVADACAAMGAPEQARRISAEEARARCDSPVFRGGTIMCTAATVQPARLALGLRRRLLERGTPVFENSRVRALREHPAGVEVETAGGRVRARSAMLTIGAAAGAVRPLERRLTTVSSHMVITEPVPDVIEALGWTGGEAITDGRALLHYFRTTRDGRIAFGWGGGRISAGARTNGSVEVDRQIVARIGQDLVRFFPSLRGREVTHAWGGPIDASPAHLPTIASLPGGRAWSVFGFTGNGVGPSHLAGRILARLAVDDRDELTRLAIVEPPPLHVPPEPFRWLGGNIIREGIERKERAEEEGRTPDPVSRLVAGIPARLGVHIGR